MQHGCIPVGDILRVDDVARHAYTAGELQPQNSDGTQHGCIPLVGINCAWMTWRVMNIRRATSQSPLQLRGVAAPYSIDLQHAI